MRRSTARPIGSAPSGVRRIGFERPIGYALVMHQNPDSDPETGFRHAGNGFDAPIKAIFWLCSRTYFCTQNVKESDVRERRSTSVYSYPR
jgi:hypothetical protein